MTTGFFWDEKCFWHSGGNYAFTLEVGGLVQPMVNGFPESPETKRRLKNLIEVTGLASDLQMTGAEPATWEDLSRVHPESYLNEFKALSDAGGGELGLRTPFGKGGFEIAAQSAGLAKDALSAVLNGTYANSYSLSRPPGHHCLPDFPNGFCLFNNIAVAIEAARTQGLAERFVVLDWDVHHGNGTEAIFLQRNDVLTISLHQDRNFPIDTGAADVRGEGAGTNHNINIPLPPGTGHVGYLAAMEQIALPAIAAFKPDVIIVACGFDAALIDPLSRMLATAETFSELTRATKKMAETVCDGRLVLVHEGGYSEVYVPFCGHAVLEVLAESSIHAEDPYAAMFAARQPGPAQTRFIAEEIQKLAEYFGTS